MPDPFLDPALVDHLIETQGRWVEWLKAKRCPCLDVQGYPTVDCGACEGLGWIFAPPVKLKALVTSQSNKGQRMPGGLVETGNRNFTPPAWLRAAENDLVRVLDMPQRGSEVLTYGASGVGQRLEQLRPQAILCITALRDGQPFDFPASAYSLGSGGAIVWDLAAPVRATPGEKLSVEYTYHEVYQVFRGEKPQNRGIADVRLSDRVPMRLVTRRALRTPHA